MCCNRGKIGKISTEILNFGTRNHLKIFLYTEDHKSVALCYPLIDVVQQRARGHLI